MRNMLFKGEISRRGQVALFVIIAIVLVGGIVLYFSLRGGESVDNVPRELAPVFSAYSSCIDQGVKDAISQAESQAGWSEIPAYEGGSSYAPFSSELNFVGSSVPYWYTITANGLAKENMPGQKEVEQGIADFVSADIARCDLSSFEEQGFVITRGEDRSANVVVSEGKVDVSVDNLLSVQFGEVSAQRSKHDVSVSSAFGELYNSAKKIYSAESSNSFLEEYAVDILRSYAPVDGVEIQCGPKVWKSREVVDELYSALEANVGALKVKGGSYTLNSKKSEYFVIKGVESSNDVRFLYLRSWPSVIEIAGEGVDQEVLLANPVGTQQGMGAMGFCYVPYHFVYDLRFPVMIQIMKGNEIFQFPVVVIVDDNVARESKGVAIEEDLDRTDICAFSTKDVTISVYDNALNPIDGEVSYGCFAQSCSLGKSSNGTLYAKAPACLNGVLEVRAEGYRNARELFSSTAESQTSIVLDKSYKVQVELEIGGKKLAPGASAIVSFVDEKGRSSSAVLPETNELELSEGAYNLSVYAYGNSTIVIPESKKTQCNEIARSGIAGIFGATKEECFDITIPATPVSSALIGGGVSEVYLLGSELEKGKIIIESDELPVPKSLEELQNNIEAFDLMGVNVRL